MKRILILFLCCTLILSLLVVPALAADTGLETNNLLDLYDDFKWYSHEEHYEEHTSTPQCAFFSEDYEIILTFGDGDSQFLAYGFTLILEHNSDLDIELRYYNPNGFSYTVPGEYISTRNGLDEYYFDVGDVCLNQFEFIFYRLDFQSSNTFICRLYEFSFDGNNGAAYYDIDMVGFKTTGTVANSMDGQYYSQTYYDNDVQIPFEYHANPTADPPSNNQMELFVSVSGDDLVAADTFIMTFVTTGIWDNYYDHNQLTTGGFYLQHHYGLPDVNIPYECYYSLMDSSWYGLPVYRITVVCDLSSYDITTYDLVFSTILNARFPNMQNDQYSDYYLRLDTVGYYIDSDLFQPWYRRFANWVTDGLKTVGNTINSAISTFSNRVNTLFSTYWTRLDSKLNEIFGINQTPPDNSDQEDQMNDAISDFNDISDDIENSRNELEDLMPEMPRWEDTGLGALAGEFGANINVILGVFHAIYENVIVTQILTYTFLFALGGFILFGER